MTRRFGERNGYIDPVQAFRKKSLREARDGRPPHKTFPPYRLADYDEPTHLHPTFVSYLDGRPEWIEWDLLYRELLHRPLQWWADRYAESLA